MPVGALGPAGRFGMPGGATSHPEQARVLPLAQDLLSSDSPQRSPPHKAAHDPIEHYTLVESEWKLIATSGFLEYPGMASP